MKTDLGLLTSDVCGLALEVAEFLKSEVSKLSTEDVQVKGIHNFVTYVDQESEKRIVDRLSKILPGSGFIAEENPGLMPAEYTWVIDPLDGTTNFIHGVPLYCISIGLMYQGETIAGVVLEPNLNECFHTYKDSPSFLNKREIHVSGAKSVNESLFATGFPYYDYSKLDDYLKIFRYLLQHSHGARRLGSAAADLAYVACGRYDGFFEYGLSPWDVCAGALLVKNAGGIVSDFAGDKNYIFEKQIIACNKLIYPEFLELFSTWDKDNGRPADCD